MDSEENTDAKRDSGYDRAPDADDRTTSSCKKSKELGGTVAPGLPFNLPDGTGAIGLVLDPAGHPMGMYSRTPIAASGK